MIFHPSGVVMFFFTKILVLLAVFMGSFAFAGVNLKNGNFYISYTDLTVPGMGKKLEITRTYNSKATEVGWFGFGWGSEYETKLEVSGDGAIIIHEHGTGARVRFTPQSGVDAVAASAKIVDEMRKKTALSDKSATELISKLSTNAELRHTYAMNFGVKSTFAPGAVLSSMDLGPQTLHVTKDGYRREHADGRQDFFGVDGKLVKLSDKLGNTVTFNYKNGKLESIKDSNAKQIFFSWYADGFVKELWSAGDKKVTYKYENSDLVYSKDVGDNEYQYVYDQGHNLTQIKYSDKTSLTVKYDPKTFFVKEIVDRKNEVAKYEYGGDPKNPVNHYWTIVTKPGFDGKLVANRYEYEIKTKPDGAQYTYRILTEINNVKTETIYNENSLPIKIARGDHVTHFEYNDSGLLLKKNSSKGEFVNIEYEPKFNKIKKVVNNQGTTNFEYDTKGNLVKAFSDAGKVVFLVYDSKGKITKMIDQESDKNRRTLAFKYNALGKPVEIDLEKVGKINVSYDNYGEIKKVESGSGHQMALQVTQAFQNLLSIVKPAGVNLNI
jgi:YD repeat-containing protein